MPVTEPVPFVRPIPPLIDQLLDAFGPERLMWASDYPPVAMREGYRNALRLVMDEVPEPHRAAVFPVRS
jgi:predicted TIM-barrel fold metal-dependent hydrolase